MGFLDEISLFLNDTQQTSGHTCTGHVCSCTGQVHTHTPSELGADVFASRWCVLPLV